MMICLSRNCWGNIYAQLNRKLSDKSLSVFLCWSELEKFVSNILYKYGRGREQEKTQWWGECRDYQCAGQGKLKYVNFSVFNLDHFKLFSSNNRGVIISTGGLQEVYFFLMQSFYFSLLSFLLLYSFWKERWNFRHHLSLLFLSPFPIMNRIGVYNKKQTKLMQGSGKDRQI